MEVTLQITPPSLNERSNLYGLWTEISFSAIVDLNLFVGEYFREDFDFLDCSSCWLWFFPFPNLGLLPFLPYFSLTLLLNIYLLLYTSPSPRDRQKSRMPSSA